jgi:hypothetical protein
MAEQGAEQRAAEGLAVHPATMRAGGGGSAYFAKVGAIFAKDVRAEVRGREVFSTMTSFSALAVLIFRPGL